MSYKTLHQICDVCFCFIFLDGFEFYIYKEPEPRIIRTEDK